MELITGAEAMRRLGFIGNPSIEDQKRRFEKLDIKVYQAKFAEKNHFFVNSTEVDAAKAAAEKLFNNVGKPRTPVLPENTKIQWKIQQIQNILDELKGMV